MLLPGKRVVKGIEEDVLNKTLHHGPTPAMGHGNMIRRVEGDGTVQGKIVVFSHGQYLWCERTVDGKGKHVFVAMGSELHGEAPNPAKPG